MTESRMRWTELEWYEVARETLAVRQRQPGIGWSPAAIIAQKRVLSKGRRRPESSLNGGARADIEAMVQRIEAGWVPDGATPPKPAPVGHEARKAARAPSAPVTPAIHPRTAQKLADDAIEATFSAPGMVRWRDHEWALIACAVRHRQVMGDSRALARVVWEAQQEVLPLDRLRKRAPLYAATDLQSQYAAGEKRLASLSARERAMCEGRLAEFDAAQAKAREGLAVAQTAAAAAVMQAAAPAPAPAPAPMVEAPPPLLAPAASAGDPLAARIAYILSDAGSRIAAETRSHVMAEYDRQLDRLTVALASTLREYVHTLVASELGPLQTPPPPPLAPAAPTASEPPAGMSPDTSDDAPPGSEPVARGPRVDIVGFPDNLTRALDVARSLNIEANVIHPDIARSMRWTPKGRDVIFMTRQASHTALERANKYAGNVMFATGGPSSLITMLETLVEHGGALQ